MTTNISGITAAEPTPKVTGVKLKRKSRLLEVTFEDGHTYTIACEMLRVYSPSAEVHGHGNPVLVTHKKNVNISSIEQVGNYAIKIVFDDGHDTGLFSWPILHGLATNQVELWEDYLSRLRAEKASREPLIDMAVQYHNK